MKIVIVSGYFTALHRGHINYFSSAKSLGDYLIVIVNNDIQQKLKKGKVIHNEISRYEVIKNIKFVDSVILAVDEDRTVNKTLRAIREGFPKEKIIFANGGDVTFEDCREKEVCEELNIELVFRIGGEKIGSSSNILKEANG